MEMEIIWQLAIMSSGIFMIMEILKHFLDKYGWFKRHKPIIPLIIGGTLGAFTGIPLVPDAAWYITSFAGMLLGSFSSSVYEMLESSVKSFKARLTNSARVESDGS